MGLTKKNLYMKGKNMKPSLKEFHYQQINKYIKESLSLIKNLIKFLLTTNKAKSP